MRIGENFHQRHSTIDAAQMDQLFITPMDLYAFQQNLQQDQLKQQQHAFNLQLHGQQLQQQHQQQQQQQQQYQNSNITTLMSTSMMPTSSSSSTMSSSSSLSSFPSAFETQLQFQHQQQQQQQQQHHHHNTIQNHFLNEHSMASMSSFATTTTASTTNTTQSSPSTLQLANSYQQFQEQHQQHHTQHHHHHNHHQQQQQQQKNKNFYNLHNHQTDSHQQLQHRQQHQQKQQQQQHQQHLQQQQQHHPNMPITTTNKSTIDNTSTTVAAESSAAAAAPTTISTTASKYLSSDTSSSSMTSTTANADANASAVTYTTTAIAGTAVAKNLQQQQQQQQQQQGSSASPYKSCWCFGESVCSGIEVEIENNNNTNHFHHGDSTFHMKILVPAVASGAIIGKGGETIATLQKDTGARVKMSKSHDFYPGTTERVCLITGTVEGIMTVLDFIMDKIREKPDLTTKLIDTEAKQTQDRDKQVKILVPNSTAGMIIGKGGAFIKQIKEESGSYVQISQKPKDISLQERCITIIGDKENNKNACKMILSKIVEDPQSGTCLNVSYADVNGPVANFNPTGSPYATNQNAINSSTASLNSTLGTTISSAAAAASLLVNGTGINLSLNLGSPNPTPNLAVATQLLEHIKVAMRGSGYSESATTEVCAALGVLAKYGVLGIGVGVPHANGAHTSLGSYLGVSALEQQTAATAASAAGNVFGAVGQVNLEQYAAAAAAAAAASRPSQSQLEAAAAAQFDPFRHLSSAAAAQATTPVSLNNNSFGLTAGSGTSTTAQTLGAAAAAHSLTSLSKSPTPGDLGAKDSKNVEIPEVIVGAILGPSGRSLVEIQHVSGANVQISKKGIFAPGTRNRIVTITGQPSAIAKAQFLIEQKINEEETKRARQIPLTTVVN